ncbi:AAA family ATPase [Criblamydia sequanensis]|uniref:AAA family ATPase n=1 Tax=Candidatus Criblamydia sequanensis CRIB-18 TaxID=1437425 RepID=A0A090E3H9_9BACT|nr:AAA family ATPase [Criblamydia sequanensis]CDR35134.1 AAA family ATPase [Criblamydia sequanensis CRIB-18]
MTGVTGIKGGSPYDPGLKESNTRKREMCEPSTSKTKGKKDSPRAEKKQRVEKDSHTVAVAVLRDPDITRAAENGVRLNPRTYEDLFPSGEKEEEGELEYPLVSVANFPFPAFPDPSVKKNSMYVPTHFFSQVKRAIDKGPRGVETVISRFDQRSGVITQLSLKVYGRGELNGFGKNDPKKILVDSLQDILRQLWQGKVIRMGQELFIKHPAIGPLVAIVDSWAFKDIEKDNPFIEKIPYYGKITSATKVKWSSGDDEIALFEEMKDEGIARFEFSVCKVTRVSARIIGALEGGLNEGWKKGEKPVPVPVAFSELSQWVREQFSKFKIIPGEEKHLQISGDHAVTIRFKSVELKKGSEIISNVEEGEFENQNEIAFQLRDHAIRISGHSQIIFTSVASEAQPANEVVFEILDTTAKENLKTGKRLWASFEEIKEAILSEERSLPIGGKIVLELAKGKFLLKLNKAKCMGFTENDDDTIKPLYHLSKETLIKVYSNKKLMVDLVQKSVPIDLESITIKPTLPDNKSKSFQRILLGEDDENKKKPILEEEALKVAFKDTVKCFLKDQNVAAVLDNGQKVNFQIMEITSKDRIAQGSYPFLYQWTPETKIQFYTDNESNLVVVPAVQDLNYDNIGETLIELGVGGVPDLLKEALTAIKLSWGDYKDYITSMDLQPERGILIYGPPGTGKTIFARLIGKLMNAQVHYYSGPDIWNKWLGGSEANVRNMFKLAREDQEKNGADSQLHVILIDEFDALGQKVGEDEIAARQSVVRTFLKELDGSAKSLNNTLVIALTNRKDCIDSAILRPGRLGLHIEMGLPDLKARKEIFQIHTKKMKNLDEGIEFDELAEHTIGQSGAFIAAICKKAVDISLRRVYQNRIPKDEIYTHSDAKITQRDFKEALLTMLDRKEEIESPVPNFQAVYQKAEVKEALKKLGFGGLSKDQIEMVLDLSCYQTYKQFFLDNGQALPKGYFIYGPSGTGKTIFAKSLMKVFNLNKNSFKYYRASSLWELQGHHLKAKLKNLFEHSLHLEKELKHEASMTMVVIDNIDWLYSTQKIPDSLDGSVFNHFIKEVEDVLEEKFEFRNLVVIGLATRHYELSDGIQREGKFGKHILLSLPDLEARKEIFEICLGKIKANGQLDEKVNVEELALRTDRRNGSFIQSLVNKAFTLAARRHMKMQNMTASLKGKEKELPLKVGMADFEKALKKISPREEWRERYI